VVDGEIAWLSGMIPVAGGEIRYKGKVGSELTLEEGRKAAALCAANLLRVLHRELGSLGRIGRVLKVTGFVNSDPGFTDQHLVMNGASEVLREVLGEAGRHARSAVGMANVPMGAALEVEMVVRLTPA
jgi:enamine deaminase RidA (YjgF/YER057c/UK114 family)